MIESVEAGWWEISLHAGTRRNANQLSNALQAQLIQLHWIKFNCDWSTCAGTLKGKEEEVGVFRCEEYAQLRIDSPCEASPANDCNCAICTSEGYEHTPTSAAGGSDL